MLEDLISKGIPIKSKGRTSVIGVDSIADALIDKDKLNLELYKFPEEMKEWREDAKRSYLASLIVDEIQECLGGDKIKRVKKKDCEDFGGKTIFVIIGDKMFKSNFESVTNPEVEIVTPYCLGISIDYSFYNDPTLASHSTGSGSGFWYIPSSTGKW